MPTITIHTYIKAQPNIVFDLARSIELHIASAASTKEKAVGGTTSGLMGLNDQVTWNALHLGVFQNFTSRITAMNSPHSFTDTMIKGTFASFQHDHFFEPKENGTLMTDKINFSSPLGILGKWFDKAYLTDYLIRFINQRNQIIKKVAEREVRNLS